MSIPSSTVAEFRLQWADRFVDGVTITRATTRGTYNTSTLKYDTPTSSSEYSDVALIRPLSPAGITKIFGDQEVTGKLYDIFVPHDAVVDLFDPEDLVTVDVAVLQPALVGVTMRVLSDELDSYNTRRRIIARMDQGSGYAG